MTQRQIFFIFIMRSKGCERKGGTMIASEFGDRSPAQQNGTNDHKLFARLVLMAFSPTVPQAAIRITDVTAPVFTVREVCLYEREVRLRLPFRFGVVTLTEAPQVFVR